MFKTITAIQKQFIRSKDQTINRLLQSSCAVIGKMRIKLKTTKKTSQNIKLELALINTDKEIEERYIVTVQNRNSVIDLIPTIGEQFAMLRKSIQRR